MYVSEAPFLLRLLVSSGGESLAGGSLEEDVESQSSIPGQAAVAYGPGKPLTVEDITVEPPRAGEVRGYPSSLANPWMNHEQSCLPL